ncbi:cell filamentation protein [Curtobacterium flaccumfaciens]|uniref:protein adenylyltransferase n=1 Tax=Curtobacterium flaccumfaciens TaxID=2035 RepID=A0A4R6DGI5_9MICO|nr:Fic family protein [Curtobacterium flaccumfaciens]TDN43394.1 cell filamentation protein [Curtobacterium flaccumfaciens]
MSVRPDGGYHDENYVLRNKFGATSRAELAALEVPEVQDRELDLVLGDVDGLDDLPPSQRVRRIHAHLFQDVYEWAGEYRLDGIAKNPEEPFLAPELIPARMARLDDELDDDDGMSTRPVEFLTRQFAVLNHIHPFMEGNGRTQREFWRQYAAAHGMVLDWQQATTAENHHSARRSMLGDLRPLRELLEKVIQPDQRPADC